ncbi:L-cystine transporter [Risungbinella massiliensis]|uniref:L-cystine transporter n=1 Tax=Risungbinella massiliensis TaxID=1329796 RepID=UPI0005CC4B1F|nr:L-cystine transporter [Risungbinella massiliensis]
MNVFYLIVNIVVFLFVLLGLFYMQKKHISFSKRVFTALGLGIILGFALQFSYGAKSEIIKSTIDWFNIVGKGYVSLLQMLVIPLVFISILSAFTKSKLSKNTGKVSALIIAVLLITTAISAAVGIGAALGFDLKAIDISTTDVELDRGKEIQETFGEIEDQTFPQKMLELLPANPFLDFTGARSTSTIAVVIFAAILGTAFLGVQKKNKEHADLFAKAVDVLYSIVMRMVTIILRLTPYGVLAIMIKAVATTDLDSVVKLGKFVVASYIALIVMFIIHLLILMIAGLNPITYIKKIMPVLTFAFTSRSSAGTLPLNVDTQTKRLGVPEGIANLAGSLGLSIGQNGCAGIYPAMLAIMIAPTVGIDPLSPSFILSLIAIVAISSFGVAGVGGGATFAAILVLSALDLPVALAGLLISVEPLIDMGRTALNVSGSMVSGVITSRVTKELDADAYNAESQEVIAEQSATV